MSPRPAPEKLDPRFYERLGEVPETLLDDRLFESVELFDRYGRAWGAAAARELGLAGALAPDVARSPSELAHRLGLAPASHAALEWVLGQLERCGAAARAEPGSAAAGSSSRWRGAGELPDDERPAVRRRALDHDPTNAPSFDLLDAAGEALPSVARGETTGEAALLGMGQTSLWLRYFDNDNPVYALNNRLAALAARNRFGPRVLEVGAGAGSASLALLEALDDAGRLGELAVYRLTEPAPFFRRRAGRALAERFPEAPVETAALDIDQPWDEQGVPAASVDLVYGVNVFHVARDLPAALGRAREALAPGGHLVIGEGLRPFPGQPIPAELPFQLLEGFRDVELDPELRPAPGFLTPELWVENLERAGFGDVAVVPDVRRLRDLYPRFFTGAVCGRRM